MMGSENFYKELKSEFDFGSVVLSKLRNGRAFTTKELCCTARANPEKIKLFLNKMISAGSIKIRTEHGRLYYFLDMEKAGELKSVFSFPAEGEKKLLPSGMKYCRHCYKHLAGYAGVKITEALLNHGYLKDVSPDFIVTPAGWHWFESLGIKRSDFDLGKRLAKQCLDFSERKNHLGGQLGDALLTQMFAEKWVIQVPDSREIKITIKGQRELMIRLEITV